VIGFITKGADFYVKKDRNSRSQIAEFEHKIKIVVERPTTLDMSKESEQRHSNGINFLPYTASAIDINGNVIA
jgi:hypothetical protein